MSGKASGFGIAAIAACLFASGAAAGQYEFLAAPQINLSLVYRLDKLSGDVIACQFAHNPGRADVGPGAFGVTSCYRSGDGATKQDPGDYGLIATRHEQEGGVFRVDNRTGALSICYLIFPAREAGRSRGDCGPICRMHAAMEAGDGRPRPFRRRGQRIAGRRSDARLTLPHRSSGRAQSAISQRRRLSCPRKRASSEPLPTLWIPACAGMTGGAAAFQFERVASERPSMFANDHDTIFALASGAGRAAIAVLRLSGPGCSKALEDTSRQGPSFPSGAQSCER